MQCVAVALRLSKVKRPGTGLVFGEVGTSGEASWQRALNLDRAVGAPGRPGERRAVGSEINGADPARQVCGAELGEQLAAVAVARLRIEEALQQARAFTCRRLVDDVEHGHAQVVADRLPGRSLALAGNTIEDRGRRDAVLLQRCEYRLVVSRIGALVGGQLRRLECILKGTVARG